VLDGDPAPLPKRVTYHTVRPTFIAAKRLDGSRKIPLGTKVGLGTGHAVFHRDTAPQKGGTAPPQVSAHVYCGQMVANLSYC